MAERKGSFLKREKNRQLNYCRNNLDKTENPYLRQHAANPVWWQAWERDVLDYAEEVNKPLFISIGYSTCHWCHVMARESFEDEEVAEILNETFICIKVDREDRPDIDSYYVNSAILLTGSAGWPLTICAVPDGTPFFAATYLPKRGNEYHTGLLDLIPRIRELWLKERSRIFNSAQSISQMLSNNIPKSKIKYTSEKISELVHQAYLSLSDSYDDQNGGFGRGTKFLQPTLLHFLLQYWYVYGEERALEMILKSLDNMRAGGLYDHVGFGFHRYATDRKWRVPHFEKMLYDQAQLMDICSLIFQVSGEPRYKKTVYEIIEFLKNNFRSTAGGYFSALDADTEGEEGKTYVWEYGDFINTLEAVGDVKPAEQWALKFNLQQNGNWTDSVSGNCQKSNIPFLRVEDLDIIFSEDWNNRRKLLLKQRLRKPQPKRDEKVITSWNGMMLSAYASAARIFKEPLFSADAESLYDFIFQHMLRSDGGLFHSYTNGNAALMGNLEDYAFIIKGLLDLYSLDPQPHYIMRSFDFADYVGKNFEDQENGAFYFSDQEERSTPFRSKSVADASYPSGNAVMLYNYATLFQLTGKNEYRERYEKLSSFLLPAIEKYPSSGCGILSALMIPPEQKREIVLTGEGEEVDKMKAVLDERYLPGVNSLVKHGGTNRELGRIAPFTRFMDPSVTAAYVCSGFQCELHVQSADELLLKLDKITRNKYF